VTRGRWARVTGIVLQGVTLGVLLFGALVMLLAVQADARLFRYQVF
jgi:hypothetical protein